MLRLVPEQFKTASRIITR